MAPMTASRTCAWMLLVLTLGAFVWVAWSWLSYCPPVAAARFAFSGAWLREEFRLVHAGTALDQPTVGKFLFWSSAMAYLACTLLLLLRVVVDSDRRGARRWMSLGAALLVGLVLTEFLAPTFLLVHYVISMGLTMLRFLGLCWCCGIWILLPAVVFRIGRTHPASTSWARDPIPWALAFSLAVPTCYLVGIVISSSWRQTAFHAVFVLVWLALVAPMPWMIRLAASGGRSPGGEKAEGKAAP